MKLNKLHIVCALFLIIINYQTASCFSNLQEPQQKRQFDKVFKDRYSGYKYNYEGKDIVTHTPRGSGNYEDYKKNKPRIKTQNNLYNINLSPLNWFFYIILALAVFYLAYVLLNEGGAGLFSNKTNKKVNSHNEISAENIENTDIDSLIKKAEDSDNYRLAIRYYYLLVLKDLSLKAYIKFEDDKTNAEYLNEINNTPFSSNFAYTSYLYNYIWYGEFPLNPDEYSKAKSNFTALLKQVK